jgi:hypothetical protein
MSPTNGSSTKSASEHSAMVLRMTLSQRPETEFISDDV